MDRAELKNKLLDKYGSIWHIAGILDIPYDEINNQFRIKTPDRLLHQILVGLLLHGESWVKDREREVKERTDKDLLGQFRPGGISIEWWEVERVMLERHGYNERYTNFITDNPEFTYQFIFYFRSRLMKKENKDNPLGRNSAQRREFLRVLGLLPDLPPDERATLDRLAQSQ